MVRDRNYLCRSGTYVAVEPFHRFRYIDEQAFRYDNRIDEKGKRRLDSERFEIALSQIAGKRLTFERSLARWKKRESVSAEAREACFVFCRFRARFSASSLEVISERGTDNTFFRAVANAAYSPWSLLPEGSGRLSRTSALAVPAIVVEVYQHYDGKGIWPMPRCVSYVF